MAILLLSILASSVIHAATLSDTQVEPRPKVALVLAGGGAKGAAHIGVLKALEELRVPVDIITGTSMGAYVGGLYATGMSASEIESFIETVDWNSGYRDRVDRSQRKVQDKEYEDRYQLTADLGFGLNGVRGKRGIVQGQGMLTLLRETTGNLPPFDSFDDLVIPYRAVATDIIHLEPVVLDNGYLIDAMMASMSVPGALPPYQLGERMLVDGGVTNNMPVDVALAMGADVVIAVDISTEYKNAEDFTNLFTVADQLSNYLVRSTTNNQAKLLTEEDIFLRPEVGSMETTEFDKMPQAFATGYQTAMDNKDQLSQLQMSMADYQTYIDAKEDARRKLRYGDEIPIERLIINNHSHYSQKLLEKRLGLVAGQQYSLEQVEQSVQNLYALDRFELVTYRYDVIEGQDTLVVDVNEKSWGPNYLNFRFFLEDDFTTDSQYSIGASANFTNLNSHGAELRTNVEIGTDKLVQAEFYTPFFSSQKTFTTLDLHYSKERRNAPINGFDDTSLSAARDYIPITYSEWVAEWALGYQDTLWRRFKTGLRYTDGDGQFSTLPSLGDVQFRRFGAFANYRIDTLDNFSFPRRGFYLDLEYLVTHDESVGDTDLIEQSDQDTSYELGAKVIAATTFSRHTLVANVDAGLVTSKNSSVPINPKEIGGFQHLSGIPRNSLVGQNKVFGSLVYRYRWFDNDFGLFTSPFYVGASLEYGGVWSDPDIALHDAPLYAAGSLFAGVDSPIGPIMLGYGRTEHNYASFYLIIGTTFK
ncbi:patatin-like phospholipase family protein [Vibrio sinaloensis]|uniref:patatin-like phospholipase family protein n=1 Tax=Photobacterium sp. (strain ATCC 43367) TaxID=379097 RepID=UPI002070E39C|nr:patatin-like phospholipase family protein [Vibrio sinaloensis]UPQ89296.1 patatin-like phospholipase family protein [Vibrio sinaloensis]